MQGMFKRKGSSKWQGRFRIPDDLWAFRDKLVEMGIEVQGTQETSRTTGEEIESRAKQKYRVMLNDFELTLEAWRDALENGPKVLNHPDTIHLATRGVGRLLEEYKEEPSEFPDALHWLDLPDIESGLSDKIRDMNEDPLTDYFGDLGEFNGLSKEDKLDATVGWLRGVMDGRNYTSNIPQHLKDYIETGLELEHGNRTNALLKEEAIEIDFKSRLRLLLASQYYIGKARVTNQERLSGIYSEKDPQWLEGAPKSLSIGRLKQTSGLTFEKVIDEEVRRRDRRIGGKPLAENTIKKYHRACAEYSKSSGSKLIHDVTLQKARAWRDFMQDDVDSVGNRTIGHKLRSLKTVLSYAIKQSPTLLLVVSDKPCK